MSFETGHNTSRDRKFSNQDLLKVLEKHELDNPIIAREEAADILNLTKIVEEEEKKVEPEVVKEVNETIVVRHDNNYQRRYTVTSSIQGEETNYESDEENNGFVDIEYNQGNPGVYGGPLRVRFPNNVMGLGIREVELVMSQNYQNSSMAEQIETAMIAYVRSDTSNRLLNSFAISGLLGLFEDLITPEHVSRAFDIIMEEQNV